MQLRLPFGARPVPRGRSTPPQETLLLNRQPVAVAFVRHTRARHYVIKVREDASVRVTVPRGGSRAEAERFIREKAEWIARERYRVELQRSAAREEAERRVAVRGEDLPIVIVPTPTGRAARFGPYQLPLPPSARSPLPTIDHYLRRMAAEELPRRLLELAGTLGRTVKAVTIRGQRTRWGSCSPTGRISLNWRLVQMPPAVSDYVLLHELTHLVHLNHSKRFWRELERVCPWHREARAWLRRKTAGSPGVG